MRTFLTAISMAIFFSTSAFASSIYLPQMAPVTRNDCFEGPGIGLRYDGVDRVCTTDEYRNKRPRPTENAEVEETTMETATVTTE